MNDLAIRPELAETFPTLAEGIRKAQSVFDSIKSFADIERVFLKGAGLSPNTYRSYLQAVKQLYEFTEGKHPLQVRPSDIEAFYDDLVKRVDRNTAYLRIRGLKKFFAGIRNILPIYTSPFEIMPEKLHEKMNRTKKGNRTKKALSPAEIRGLLAWLRGGESVRSRGDYAIVFMLVTSGLRSAELCQLKWSDLEFHEGSWKARFIGKGGHWDEQELYPAAVQACREYFRAKFNRDPLPTDALFWTEERYNGDLPRPLTYHTLWQRITTLGKAARLIGIIKRELSFSPHLFRRSYATLLDKSGMHLKAIQEKTRHASIEVLAKHYIDDSEPASPHFDKLFGGAA
jgi:integrase/recombinase XerD